MVAFGSTHGRRISVIGLGYVGLPVATAFAASGTPVVGFDIDARRIAELGKGYDRTGEVAPERLGLPNLRLTDDIAALADADFHIVTVPTPITKARRPDLGPLLAATATVGKALKAGDIVVYESTVYPGATEESCVPLLEHTSGLVCGRDFHVGYSPERINPGDAAHRFETITKVVAGCDAATTAIMAAVYGSVVAAGIHQAPSIKVAEAAKVIENTQRDLNIALMNELALIFDRVGVRTKDVLAAAGTKWNFLPFTPGLVGGHCIGVDPYYLTDKAEALGYHPEVILAGRRTNDFIATFVAQKLIKLMIGRDIAPRGARVGVLGLTFKENVPDLRNSQVPEIVSELADYGIDVLVHDPMADPAEARHEYGLDLVPFEDLARLDALVLAVPHRTLLEMGVDGLCAPMRADGVVIDVKSALDPADVGPPRMYWSL